MNKRNRRWRLLLFPLFALALLLGGMLVHRWLLPPMPQTGVFSWKRSAYQTEPEQTLETLAQLQAGQLYQYFGSTGLESPEAAVFAAQLQGSGIELFALLDGGDWKGEQTRQSLRERLAQIVAFNQDAPLISGIMLDIEPYQAADWKENADELMADMARSMAEFYPLAAVENLRVYFCVPVWYASRYPAETAALTAASDGLCVMNYNRRKEIENMAFFVKTAKAQDKEVLCAFEFQAVGSHDLTENETYANAGLDAATQSFGEMFRHYRYPALRLAYHYLGPVEALLQTD